MVLYSLKEVARSLLRTQALQSYKVRSRAIIKTKETDYVVICIDARGAKSLSTSDLVFGEIEAIEANKMV